MKKTDISTLKYYLGNKRIGEDFPVLVVGATNRRGPQALEAEYYLFLGLEKSPYVSECVIYMPFSGGTNPEKQSKYREAFRKTFSIQTVFEMELKRAKAGFAKVIRETNEGLYKNVFENGFEFEFKEFSAKPLIEFKMFDKHEEHISAMLNSPLGLMDKLKGELESVPRVNITPTR